MTGETSKTLNGAREKCENISAKLPIIKSECENRFILGLMSKQKSWVWLAMERKEGKMVWFDGTPAESSDGAPYNAWRANEPSNQVNENCAYLGFKDGRWNDNKCNFTPDSGPSVLCKEERKKDG